MPDFLDRLRSALADRFLIERELGRGGMAIVYLAEDRRHQRRVALKVLRPELAASIGAERFLREIRTAARLTHPNILALHDSGEADGTLYYTMPYVEGESLRDRLNREKQLPIEDALRITKEVADALGYAHEQRIVHRDIKPENILFQRGHALVADFGIARAVTAAGAETLTETGLAVGPPYAGPTAQAILARKLTDPLPPVTTVRDTVPGPVETALAKALAKNPVDRFATTRQFSEALAVDPARHRQRARVRRLLWRLGGALVVLLVVGSSALGLSRYRAGTSWRRAPLDPKVVAVMPFRVTGTDPRVASLGEGIQDLLYPVLAGGPVPRMVEIGSLQRAWQDMQRRGWADATDAPLRLAARFSAGLLLQGGIVQVGDRLIVNGSLLRVPDGAELANASVEVPLDSLATLPARLVVKLLAGQLGEGRERLTVLERYPQEAVLAYLAGARAYRNADLATSMREFERALAIDSTFALAALRAGQIPIIPGEFNPDRPAAPFVRRRSHVQRALPYRSMLAPRDQAVLQYLIVRRGVDSLAPNTAGVPTTVSRNRAAARAWAEAVPDDPEAWLELSFFQDRSASGGIPAEARRALERAWSLDSVTAQNVERQLVEAIDFRDRALVARVGARYLQVADTTTPYYPSQAWNLALLRGDSAEVRGWRARAERGDPRVVTSDVMVDLTWTAYRLDFPLSDADLVRDRLFAQARTRADSVALVSPPDAPNSGQFRLGLQRSVPPELVLSWALIYPQLDSAADAVVDQMSASSGEDPNRECLAELYRVVHGDTVGVRDRVRRLEPEIRRLGLAGLCPATVAAFFEVQLSHGPVAPALERLDSIVRLGPWTEAPLPFAMVAVPRLWRARGEYRRALAAARWRFNGPPSAQAEAALFREEGDLALIVGDTAAAVTAYNEFLRRWHLADDLGRLWTDSVRATLAELASR